jgi:inorganic pyrophosphatase/exopolyphosphatase
MKVVTSGRTYIDIDAYGGCIAYAELLNLLGEEAIAATSSPLNESVTASIRNWGGKLQHGHKLQKGDEFILIDVSNPDFFDEFVDRTAVTEVIDHHTGFESYWHERLGDKANIEFIGAACTQVFEQFVAAGKEHEISQTSARLLIAGILDNTLDFKAHVSTPRDKNAYDKLMERANLPSDWPAQYFSECQQAITAALEQAIKNDVKSMEGIEGLPDWLGQLVIWDATTLLNDRKQQIADVMSAHAGKGTWAMNIVSIDEGKSYLLAEATETQAQVSKLLNITFQDNVAVADRLWLRKEIMKVAYDVLNTSEQA